jgi:hypothetical protein
LSECSAYYLITVAVTYSYAHLRRTLSGALKRFNGARTSENKKSVTKQTTILLDELNRYRLLQDMHIPGAISAELKRRGAAHPESAKLHLPSEFIGSSLAIMCPPKLVEMEAKLREGMMDEHISDLCGHLRTRAQHAMWKFTNVRGVKDGTKTLTAYWVIQILIEEDAAGYRHSRVAKEKLCGAGSWESSYPVLKDSDLRGLNTDEPTDKDLASSMAACLHELSLAATDAWEDVSAVPFDEDVPTGLEGEEMEEGTELTATSSAYANKDENLIN